MDHSGGKPDTRAKIKRSRVSSSFAARTTREPDLLSLEFSRIHLSEYPEVEQNRQEQAGDQSLAADKP